MKRRLFLAGLMQETNDFSPIPTSAASFEGQSWDPRTGAHPSAERDTLGYGAVLEGAGRLGFDVAAAPFYTAWPAMPTGASTWQSMRQRILDDLEAALPVNAVFLFLHGAMSAQGEHDCEGDLISAIRRRVGPEVPIAAEYDLHGNLSQRMMEADFTLACREYPHVDHAERSLQAVELMAKKLDGLVEPKTTALRVPATGIFGTLAGPMVGFVERLRAIEERPHILSASVFHGFFAADNPDMGASVVVTAHRDAALAQRTAEEIARDLASTMVQVQQCQAGVEEALDQVEASPGGLVVLADRADNAGGGAASDSTHILRAVLERGMTGVAIALFWDKLAVELAHAAGEGARLPLRVGGKVGPLSGPPVDLEVEILAVRNDVRQAWFGEGEPRLALGASAAVRAHGVTMILCSNRQQVFSRHVFTGHGIDLSEHRLLVVKSTTHFYNDFSRLSDAIILCDAPGTVTLDLSSLPYRSIRRPVWPLDPAPIGGPTLIASR